MTVQADHLAGLILASATDFAIISLDLSGKLANSPEAIIRLLRSPQTVVPGNGMPDQSLSEQEARDAAVYLCTL